MDSSIPAASSTHNVSGTFVCWRTILGGVLISILAYMIFSSLGAGIGGLTVSHIIEKGGTDSGLLTGAGLWVGGSIVVSIFLGTYFATRFSFVTHKQVAACNALMIASIFFYLSVNSSGLSIGSLSNIVRNLAENSTSAESDIAARAFGDVGWLLFATLLLGVVAAVFGAIEGVIGNMKRPFSKVLVQ